MEIAPFELERYFARYEFEVPWLLCTSDCESFSMAELLALEPEASDRLAKLRLGYTESRGTPGLRQAISRLYATIAPENVLVYSGAEEAIFIFTHAVLRPGDHVLVHWPCYQSLSELPRSIGCEVTHWRAVEEQGWALDLGELPKLVRSNTRVLMLNLPHNPTGALLRSEEFRALVAFAEERKIVVFSDEVYRESEYDAKCRLPAACDLSPCAISLGAMSKTWGLPGLRIGWLATRNAQLLEKMMLLRDYTTICCSGPSEFLAELALCHREKLRQRNLEIIRRNLQLLEAFFARHADRFAWQRPNAGPVTFPRLRSEEAATFCEKLVKQAGVLLLPGTVFGDAAHHVRFGFGRANMPEALHRLGKFLSSSPA